MLRRLKSFLTGSRARTVVVLGMHKSGTSVVAAIVSALGIHLGDELLGPDSSNPLGHYEDLEILELNERILAASGGSWLHPPPRSALLENRDQFVPEIKEIVESRNSEHTIWGWKDPRSVYTLELFLPQLSRPRLLVVRRDADAVAQSLLRRDSIDLSAGRDLWREYNARIDDILRRYPYPRLEVQFDSVRRDARKEVARIAHFVRGRASSQDLDRCTQLVLGDADLQSARQRLKKDASSEN